MKLSIIISIYESYEIVDRQTKYFNKMGLPNDIEFIFVDDGSNPPLYLKDYNLENLKILYTNNKLAWTQGLGRNLGAKHAVGDYLLFTDIDHIISSKALDDVYDFEGSFMRFTRHFGILDSDGNLKTDRESLKEYGLADKYLNKEVMDINSHRNTFAIRRNIFNELGGYDPKYSMWGYHPKSRHGDDCYFDGKWRRYASKNNLDRSIIGSNIYVFPNGRFHKEGELNPWGLFHDLSHKQESFNKDE